jgi:hypothetical protein
MFAFYSTFLAGFAFLCFGIKKYREVHKQAGKLDASTTADVVAAEPQTDDNDKLRGFKFTYKSTINGKMETFTEYVGLHRVTTDVGETVTIHYETGNLSNFSVGNRDLRYDFPKLILTMGGVLLLYSVFLIFKLRFGA